MRKRGGIGHIDSSSDESAGARVALRGSIEWWGRIDWRGRGVQIEAEHGTARVADRVRDRTANA